MLVSKNSEQREQTGARPRSTSQQPAPGLGQPLSLRVFLLAPNHKVDERASKSQIRREEKGSKEQAEDMGPSRFTLSKASSPLTTWTLNLV